MHDTWCDFRMRVLAEERLKGWMSSVRRSGMFDVRHTKTPAGQWTRRASRWTGHHRLHQEMVMAWAKEEISRGAVHSALTRSVVQVPRPHRRSG